MKEKAGSTRRLTGGCGVTVCVLGLACSVTSYLVALVRSIQMNMLKPKEQLSCCARTMLASYGKHTLIQPEKQLCLRRRVTELAL